MKKQGISLKLIAHITGKASLLASAIIVLYMFYSIISLGYFRAQETSSTILITEIIVLIYGLAYGVYLISMTVRDVLQSTSRLSMLAYQACT